MLNFFTGVCVGISLGLVGAVLIVRNNLRRTQNFMQRALDKEKGK